jgi:hypothetical protein
MIYVLSNDARLARRWAERQNLPADHWTVATTGKLKALASGEHPDKKLVILDDAELNPQLLLMLEIARDRGIEPITVSPTDSLDWLQAGPSGA